MNEHRILFVEGVLPQNSNTVELVKFLYKYQKLHIQIKAATLKVTSYNTMSQEKFGKK
jgi:hypothetical protein